MRMFLRIIATAYLVLVGYGTASAQEFDTASLRETVKERITKDQNDLGGKYGDGKGVPQNDDEAMKWPRKAAEQADAGAQNDVGVRSHNSRLFQDQKSRGIRSGFFSLDL